MKVFFNRRLFLLPVMLLFLHAEAQTQLKVFMQNTAFLSAKSDTPYVETYLGIPARSLQYHKNKDGKFEGSVDISLSYFQDTSLVAKDHYVLHSPEIKDTGNLMVQLLDVRRLSLSVGDYSVDLVAFDVNKPYHKVGYRQGLQVEFPEGICFSGIEFIDSYKPTVERNQFSKNGYDIRPMAISYFPSSMNTLSFYTEIYHADEALHDSNLIILYSIKSNENDEVQGQLMRFTRQKASEENVLFSAFDISSLPSGNYRLNIQVKNKSNQLMGEQNAFFIRRNAAVANAYDQLSTASISDFVQRMPGDSMNYYIRSIIPRADANERNYIKNAVVMKDTTYMKKLFSVFWHQQRPSNPEQAWNDYKELLDAVNAEYSTQVQPGFATDRGRVYLQYGAPNRIEGNNHEPGAYPYEVWQYYKLDNNQTNVRFVFYNPDEITNDYLLINSDALGEIYDPRWRLKVYDAFKYENNYQNMEQTDVHDAWGNELNDIYENH